MSEKYKTLEQIRDALQCTDETGLNAEACYELGENMDAILREREQAQTVSVPGGWQLVPKVATQVMRNAAVDVDCIKLGDISPLGFRMSPQRLLAKCYEAMLASAPTAHAADAKSNDARDAK